MGSLDVAGRPIARVRCTLAPLFFAACTGTIGTSDEDGGGLYPSDAGGVLAASDGSHPADGRALESDGASVSGDSGSWPSEDGSSAGDGSLDEGGPSFEFPAEGRASGRELRLVPTLESVSLYWAPVSGASAREVLVRYRRAGSRTWRPGQSLWFDERDLPEVPVRSREYRGSLVHLAPGTEYQVEVFLTSESEVATGVVRTWPEALPVARTVELPAMSTDTLSITESGSPEGYVLYAPPEGASAVLDVGGRSDYNVFIDASYVILRGVTLRNAAVHGIVLGRSTHHVAIQDNDISGWGRVASDGWGVDSDSAIGNDRVSSSAIKAIRIERNRIHHPRSDANNWRERRPVYDTYHPLGPQGITLWNTGGNHVIRHNEIYSDAQHYMNDGIGAGSNFSYSGGSPGPDSDVYGNRVSHCWDDGIEAEGANVNVRIWGNYLDLVYVSFGISSTSVGPLYIFRNVSYRHQYTPSHSTNVGVGFKAQSRVIDGTFYGGGRVYIYHNTFYRTSPDEGVQDGISAVGQELTNTVSRNNILDHTAYAIKDQTMQESNDFDYDLLEGQVLTLSSQELNGTEATPSYDGAGASGIYALASGTPGHDDGVVLPGFNDGFFGSAPDRGAQERGAPALSFGSDGGR